MRSLRLAAALVAALGLFSGCGGKREAVSHETEAASPAPPPPTPDTTPVVALRTPAGIALKSGETAAAPTPAPK